jgi:thiamine biosynthesis lipoprotein
MGIKAGLFMVDQIPGLHAIVIDDHNNVYTSKNIKMS